MNRTLKFAFGVVLGLGLVMPAAAQNFPDIPDNHWAYEALANLKGKILFGYPDGLYRPARPMSRAEFAVAINHLYQMMMAKDNQLQSAIDALAQRVTALENRPVGQGGVTRQEFDALKRQVDEMQTRLNSMQSWGQDINNLKRLATEFERELAAQGVDIDAMKRDFADLKARVDALEKGGGSGMPFNIHGDAGFVVTAGHSTDSLFGMTKTGRVVGIGQGGSDFDGDAVGMTGDLDMFHEINVTMDGKAGENVGWTVSMNVGNMLGWYDFYNFGDMNSQGAGLPIDDHESNVFYLDQANAKFDTSVAGQGFTATVGRFRHSGGAFFMSRPDYTEFYSNDRWDNGEFIMDGARLNFDFGSVDLTVLAARNSDRFAVGEDSVQMNLMMHDLGDDEFQVDSMLGFELGAALGSNGNLRGVYYLQDSYDVDSGINRMSVYGGELNYKFGSIDFYGVYSQTDFGYNTNVMLDTDNAAWAGWLAYNTDRWGFDAGYARVEGNFGAFGSWGRLGTQWNPTNIEGFGGGVWFKLNDRIKLMAGAAMFDGAEDTSGLFGLPITTDDQVQSYHIGVDYMLNSAWNLNLGYENVKWDFDAGLDPSQRWYNIGLSHNLSESSQLKIMYLMSDVDFKGVGSLDPFGDSRYKGGILSTQMSFKF
jgi:hypothetical protein